MKSVISLIVLVISVTTGVKAQLISFALKTNNQQLIDQAIDGALVKIVQSYELTDTVSGECFGRNNNGYFSKISYIGVLTEKGLCYPLAAMTPWEDDSDFEIYKNDYIPALSNTEIFVVSTNSTDSLISYRLENKIESGKMAFDTDSIYTGLCIDSQPGEKQGWIVWISEDSETDKPSGIKYLSILKTLDVTKENDSGIIDAPEIDATLLGGIFIVPVQTRVGYLTFRLVGVVLPEKDKWTINYPFLVEVAGGKSLTRIDSKKEDIKMLNGMP